MKNTDILTEFEIVELKKLCWNNLGEFYSRYRDDLDMSQSWFYRAMQGQAINEYKVQSIQNVLDKIRILNAPDLKDIFEDLVEKVNKFSASHNFEDFVKIEKWMEKYGKVFRNLY